jgi:hypothetical protein
MLLGSKLIAYWLLGWGYVVEFFSSISLQDGRNSCLGAPSIASRSVDQSVKVIEVQNQQLGQLGVDYPILIYPFYPVLD